MTLKIIIQFNEDLIICRGFFFLTKIPHGVHLVCFLVPRYVSGAIYVMATFYLAGTL